MPKKVDSVERKNKIAEAIWRVILNKGIDKASIQSIADEANMSVGLIQHNFPSKERMIHYAMELILKRMEERAKARLYEYSGTKEEMIRRLIKFLIPINQEEIAEARVWISFLGRSFSDPELFTLQQKMDRYSRSLVNMIVELMMEEGYLEEEINKQFELEILYALIDGMVIHALQNPDFYTEQKVEQLIEYYLVNVKGRKENG